MSIFNFLCGCFGCCVNSSDSTTQEPQEPQQTDGRPDLLRQLRIHNLIPEDDSSSEEGDDTANIDIFSRTAVPATLTGALPMHSVDLS